MSKWFKISSTCALQEAEFGVSKHGNPHFSPDIFIRYFLLSESHGQVKNHPCFLEYEKNCIRMKIISTAFLAIAITITSLTNRFNTKYSLLWQKILMMLQSVLNL